MPLLTIATFLPILAGLALMALPDRSTKTAHTVSIAATGAVFVEIDGMGHDYPPEFWRRWIDEWTTFVASVPT